MAVLLTIRRQDSDMVDRPILSREFATVVEANAVARSVMGELVQNVKAVRGRCDGQGSIPFEQGLGNVMGGRAQGFDAFAESRTGDRLHVLVLNNN